jgi:hypothetical protein
MSTMDGLKIRVESEELKEHLLTRVSHHSERADYYAKKVAMAKDEEEAQPNFSNSMRQNDRASELSHRSRAAYFKFMADHLFVGITYILDRDDVNQIEISG